MTVYVLSTDRSGAYKIGYTDDWAKRVVAYNSHAYQTVVHCMDPSGGQKDEYFLHKIFEPKRAELAGNRREWFMLNAEDLQLLKDLFEGPGLWAVSSVEGSSAQLLKHLQLYVAAWNAELLISRR
jgi:hypothetical protein